MRAVDLFAGAGGFTEGAKQAGINVVWAGNHWRDAVEIHAANHPEVMHVCQDLQQANWLEVPTHDILLASPACQGHSLARGKDKPHHDAYRSTAWAVVECLEVHRPPLFVAENVEGFRRWCLLPAWKQALRILGYALSENLVDAADYGVPQNRTRLFIIGTRSKAPLRLKPRDVPHVPIAPYIDWHAPESAWRTIDGTLAKATRDRIKRGRAQFGDRFLFPYYKSGSGLTGRSIHRPVGTITTKDRWAIVDGDRMRMFSVDECRAAMGFRPDYKLPSKSTDAKKMLGNAVCPPKVAEILRELKAVA